MAATAAGHVSSFNLLVIGFGDFYESLVNGQLEAVLQTNLTANYRHIKVIQQSNAQQ